MSSYRIDHLISINVCPYKSRLDFLTGHLETFPSSQAAAHYQEVSGRLNYCEKNYPSTPDAENIDLFYSYLSHSHNLLKVSIFKKETSYFEPWRCSNYK